MNRAAVDEHGREVPKQVSRTAADAVIIRLKKDGSGHEIMLITRLKKTFQNCLAFPGGHVDYDEDPKDACIRELKEECGVDGANPKLITVRGKKGRDPRYHVIAIVYLVEVAEDAVPIALDDAATVGWYDFASVMKTPEKFAFDHHSILEELCA